MGLKEPYSQRSVKEDTRDLSESNVTMDGLNQISHIFLALHVQTNLMINLFMTKEDGQMRHVVMNVLMDMIEVVLTQIA